EKEMEVYRVTESLQREKAGLLKQLDFLRERNKHLRDERDICFQKNKAAKANTAASRASWKKRSGSVIGKYVDSRGILRRWPRRDRGIPTLQYQTQRDLEDCKHEMKKICKGEVTLEM
ncbi:CRACR2A isoform 6, partial [Pan troglodytes]